MTTTSTKRNYYIVFLIMLTFFVISFLTNIIGALIPDIKTGFHLSLTEVAIFPFAFFIAYGVMSIPFGILNEKYKEKKIMIAAFVLSFAGSLLLVLFPNYSSYIVSLFLIGCGMAMLPGKNVERIPTYVYSNTLNQFHLEISELTNSGILGAASLYYGSQS